MTTTPPVSPDPPQNTVSLPARRRRRRGPLVAGIVAGVVLLVGGGTAAAVAFGVSRAQALQSDSRTETFPAVREIVVDADAGAVRFTAGPETVVRTTWSWAPGDEPTTARTLTAGVLRVTADCPDVNLGCEVEHEITVPAGVPVRVTLVDGAVTAAGLDVPVFTATTVNGAIDAGFATRPTTVDLETVNGSVLVTVPPGGYRVTADSTVGTVAVRVPDDPARTATITADTVAGSVTVQPG